jgi:hypothetical protein
MTHAAKLFFKNARPIARASLRKIQDTVIFVKELLPSVFKKEKKQMLPALNAVMKVKMLAS